MATNLASAIQGAGALVLLVKHTEFSDMNPVEIKTKTAARIVVDCVNGWDHDAWKDAGFKVFRLGVYQ